MNQIDMDISILRPCSQCGEIKEVCCLIYGEPWCVDCFNKVLSGKDINDMRLIDADAIPEKEMNYPVWVCLKKQPTIDAVPVVRCGECERRNKSADLTDTIYCPWLKLQMRKTDFCSYGEPKEDTPNVNHSS